MPDSQDRGVLIDRWDSHVALYGSGSSYPPLCLRGSQLGRHHPKAPAWIRVRSNSRLTRLGIWAITLSDTLATANLKASQVQLDPNLSLKPTGATCPPLARPEARRKYAGA